MAEYLRNGSFQEALSELWKFGSQQETTTLIHRISHRALSHQEESDGNGIIRHRSFCVGKK